MNNVSNQFENTMVKREVASLMNYLRDRVGEKNVPEKYVVSALLTVAGEMEELIQGEMEEYEQDGNPEQV